MKKFLLAGMMLVFLGASQQTQGMVTDDLGNKLTQLKGKLTGLKTSLEGLKQKLTDLKDELNEVVYITVVHGDITSQQFEDDSQAAIVNAANEAMLGGGGIDKAIHDAAGRYLYQECLLAPIINGERCPTGEAKLTMGHNLDKGLLRIIHTVGPIGLNPNKAKLLSNAYTNCLILADKPQLAARQALLVGKSFQLETVTRDVKGKIIEGTKKITIVDMNNFEAIGEQPITAIAFNCISTAIFGYDIHEATPVALKAVFDYLTNTPGSKIKEVRFVVFSVGDYNVYKNELPKIAGLVSDTSTTPDLKLEESSVGGQGKKQDPLRFKFIKK